MQNHSISEGMTGRVFSLVNSHTKCKEEVFIPFDAVESLDEIIASEKHSLFVGNTDECFQYLESNPCARQGRVASAYILSDGRCALLKPHHHDRTAQSVLPPAMIPNYYEPSKDFVQEANAFLMPLYAKAIRVQMYPDGIGITVDLAMPPNLRQLDAIREYYAKTDKNIFVAEIQYDTQMIAWVRSWNDVCELLERFPGKASKGDSPVSVILDDIFDVSCRNINYHQIGDPNDPVNIRLKNWSGEIVISGYYPNARTAIEQNRNVLREADLSSAELNDDNIFKLEPSILNKILASLPGVDLRGADLRNVDLSRANLFNADLKGVDMQGAMLRGAVLCYADLRGARLSHADICRADLRHADLSGADLQNADLGFAKMDHCRIDGTNMSCTSMAGTSMCGVNMDSANFDGTDLSTVKDWNIWDGGDKNVPDKPSYK